MSHKPKVKTNITKITAKSTPKAEVKAEKVEKSAPKPAKAQKTSEEKKKIFILARPFVALGRYLRDSWREIRQVRWPGRKATWKMTFAVFIYCAIFMVFILVLDALFTFIFNLLLGTN